MKKLLFLIITAFLFSNIAFAQERFEPWDSNYPFVDIIDVLKADKLYADSVEASDINTVKYYAIMDKYSFIAMYTGEKRKVSKLTMTSMKEVFKISGVYEYNLDKMIKYEYQFMIEDTFFWMPMQKELDKYFKAELEEGDQIKLYCMLFNEHLRGNILNNILLISAYKKP